ncbi:MAG: hypothetical protein CMJ83_06565 [Planctomycetes bacterium]|nr:hypothetical protein [Planctomycetota bacterium]
MPDQTRTVAPAKKPGCVTSEDGVLLRIPQGWELLPPGDAGLTRKLKSLGPTWTIKVQKRRRLQSIGVWAPAESVAEARRLVEAQRERPEYARRRTSDARRRERAQSDYVDEFVSRVVDFLAFDGRHAALAERMAHAVAAHATPVGSGTVARTQRIPVERRAEAAVIAWMRHHTTAYDHMKIARVRGKRREVRRMLADVSRQLLDQYRRGDEVASCPLAQALERTDLGQRAD